MRFLLLCFIAFTGLLPHAKSEDDFEKSAIWITGEPLAKEHVLFFRADKPIKDNPLQDVVILGSIKQTANALLPMYMQAAEKHIKLRLYGVLLSFSGSFPDYKDPLPNVQFITWKVHMPGDPDVLPADQRIELGPEVTVPGYKVEISK